MQEVTLLQDLAFILITAGLSFLAFKRFKQPIVVGYLLAGFLIGPNAQSFYNVSIANIQAWADIGIVFILFSLGLEFSFKKLFKTGLSSGIAATIEIPIVFFMGYFFAGLMGWDYMTRIFLGSIMCISSTAIIYRSLDELNLRGRSFTQYVFGVLIFEDIVAILLMVLLPSLSLSQNFSGYDFIFQGIKMFAFITLWFIAGIFLLPTLFRKIKKLADDELYVLLSLGLCFSMVAASVYLGFSAALGAFVMGSLLAETDDKHRITKVFNPIRNLFAAIFFVSIGMLIAPGAIKEHILLILAISALILVGKSFIVFLCSLVAGQSLVNATLSAASVAQIGEFSFILAQLGVSNNLIADDLFPIVVGVAIITTFATPYWMRFGVLLAKKPEVWFPSSIQKVLVRYDNFLLYLSSHGFWMKNIQRIFIQMLIFSVLIFFVFLAIKYLEKPFMLNKYLALFISCAISAPFIWAMIFKKNYVTKQIDGIIFALRFSFTFVFLLTLSSIFFIPLEGYIFSVFILLLFLMWHFSKSFSRYYKWYENHFLNNYSSADKTSPQLAPWDIHISSFDVEPFAKVVGKSLVELKIRQNYGITIASIYRGGRNIFAPGPFEVIYPHDRLSVIGGDNEIQSFKEDALKSEPLDIEAQNEALTKESVEEDLNHTQIKDAEIRQRYNGIVVGVERTTERHLNPSPEFELKTGDILWLLIQSKA